MLLLGLRIQPAHFAKIMARLALLDATNGTVLGVDADVNFVTKLIRRGISTLNKLHQEELKHRTKN